MSQIIESILSSFGSMIETGMHVFPYLILIPVAIVLGHQLAEALANANFRLGDHDHYKQNMWTLDEEEEWEDDRPIVMPPETAVALDAIRRCVEEITIASNQIRAHRKGRRWRETEC